MRNKAEQCYQCTLVRPTWTGFERVVAWVPKRAAKVGKRVQLLPDKDPWSVKEVFDGVEQSTDELKEREMINRRGLPSVEKGWRD